MPHDWVRYVWLTTSLDYAKAVKYSTNIVSFKDKNGLLISLVSLIFISLLFVIIECALYVKLQSDIVTFCIVNI